MKHYTNENFKKHERIHFLDYLKYTCINAANSDFINKFITAIHSDAPIRKVRAKANSKPCTDLEIISAIYI